MNPFPVNCVDTPLYAISLVLRTSDDTCPSPVILIFLVSLKTSAFVDIINVPVGAS